MVQSLSAAHTYRVEFSSSFPPCLFTVSYCLLGGSWSSVDRKWALQGNNLFPGRTDKWMSGWMDHYMGGWVDRWIAVWVERAVSRRGHWGSFLPHLTLCNTSIIHLYQNQVPSVWPLFLKWRLHCHSRNCPLGSKQVTQGLLRLITEFVFGRLEELSNTSPETEISPCCN